MGYQKRNIGDALKNHPRSSPLCTIAFVLFWSTSGVSQEVVFSNQISSSGIDFRYSTGAQGAYHLPEIMGGGVALIDADQDGRLDLFFPDGGPIIPSEAELEPGCRIYLNQGGWRFRDVSQEAGIAGPRYAMGVAVGDCDGDGRDDLFVSGWGEQRLYRNLGAGRFQDITEAAGLAASDRWGTSAAFADLDGDGDLDLYVGCYVTYDPRRAPYCTAPDGERDYCGPETFPAQPDHLYRNNGNLTFTDVSIRSGIAHPRGRALGVLVADLDGDARPDLYVANDGTPSFLFLNRGDLQFEEVGQVAGVAFDRDGVAPAGMGTALGDLDGDGRSELLVTNFLGRGTLAFRSLGDGLYREDAAAFGLDSPTRPRTGFGLGLADLDGDGDLDLLQANGHVLDRARCGEPLAQPLTLLRNDDGRFVDVSRDADPVTTRAQIGRGVAVGDLDDDGRVDAVVATLDGPPLLLRNETPMGNRLTIALRSRAASPYGSRAWITVNGRTTIHDMPGGGSYLAARDQRLHVGLGNAPRVERIMIQWPSGRVECWEDVSHGAVTFHEGSGRESGPEMP